MSNKDMKKGKTKKIHISPLVIVLFVVLFLYSISLLLLLGWGLLSSLKNHLDFGTPTYNVLGFPILEGKINSREELFQLKNYRFIIENFHFRKKASFYSRGTLITHEAELNLFNMLMYTILYAGIGAFIVAIVPCVVGYICAKYDFWYSKVVYTMALIVLSLPSVGAYASELTLLRNLGLYDTFLGNFIQKFSFTGMYFFIYYAYFRGVASTYSEAAEIDGASQWKILVQIILPLAIKMLSTVYLIKFIELWNDYQTAVLYLPTHPTLAYGVYEMSKNTVIKGMEKVPVRIASCMLIALPMIILFVVLRDKIMGNVSMGGLKE